MASDKDVLGKADALLRKHAVASPSTGTDTGGVPVLTDLVENPAAGPSDELAREVYKRVVAAVEGRLAADLEQRVAQNLVPLVHAAVGAALSDVRQELANAIGDAVAAALKGRQVR